MIRLHYSNRLEELVAPLAAAIGASQRRDPLARTVVVVPNRIVEEFVKLRLAEAAGVAANIEFPFLRRFLAKAVAAADPAAVVLDADDLELAVFECLRAGLDRDERDLAAVKDYVARGSRTEVDVQLRLFELSARTARLLREYAISRASILARWRGGTAPELESMRATERWQRRLYLSLLGPGERLKPQWVSDPELRCFPLTAALAAVPPERLRQSLSSPLHIFGLSYTGPEFIRMFSKIGELAEVHIYALNPCLEFWEDLDTLRPGAADRWVRRGHKLGGELESAADPFKLDLSGDNLALRLWGRPGREYIRLLNELTQCDFDAHFRHPLTGGDRGSLLARVQESILCREPESTAPPPSNRAAPAGDSIRFVACPGIRREVEIAANSIWSLIHDDRADAPAGPLRFHQIAVLIPDAQLESYLPHVETVFAEQHQIPLNMVDRPFSDQRRVVEAVQLLLRLPLGKFTRDEMLHLLTHPALAGQAHPDTELWERWCESLGVFFGADGRELSGTYIPPGYYHWDQALSRLALGVFMSGTAGGEAPAFSGPDGSEYLPQETAQDEIGSVAALIANARRLIAEALDLRGRSLPLRRWAGLLGDLVRTYINPADPAGRAVAADCAAAIESMAPEELSGDPVCYAVACARAEEKIGAGQSEQGRYAESGVAVGSFSALRSIPFRVIFALGMAEGAFPEREKHDLLDLRLARRHAGDVSANQRDRYLFLETLLAARERILLSWVARDQLTGEELEPSPVIRELKLILRGYVDEQELAALTINHPRSRYDLKYFPDLAGAPADGGLVSFDRHARRGARMAALRADLVKACRGVALPESGEALLEMLEPGVASKIAPLLQIVDLRAAPDTSAATRADSAEITLSLGALRRYLECPLQGASRYALGMREDEERDDEDLENEPLTQPLLDRVMLLRETFWAGRGEARAVRDEFDKALRIYQLKGRAPMGPFADAARTAFGVRLDLCVTQAQALRITGLHGWQRVRIGSADEGAEADRILPAIVLDVPMPGPGRSTTIRRVSLRGTVTVSPKRDASIRCIVRSSGARARDFLEGALGALALAAADDTRAKSFTAIALGGSEDGNDPEKLSRRLPLPAADAAKTYLTTLAADLFSAHNHHFLPIEAVEEIMRKVDLRKVGERRRIVEIIDEMRENEWHRCSSDYGPIRNAREYKPPDAQKVIEIIRRRFDPIKGIFAPKGRPE